MLQRATYKELLKYEKKAVSDYTLAINKSDNEHEKKVLDHIRAEEIEHIKELNELLNMRVERKGQTDIVNLLSLH